MTSEPVRVPEKIRFDEGCELDLRAYELRRSGRLLRLERIPTELLLLLMQQKGQLVTREQIVERIWGKGVFLDTDNSINGAIRKIRQVLKDDPAHPRFIQTIAGRGYRFIAPVVEGDPDTHLAAVVPEMTGARSALERPVAQRWPVVLAIAAMFVAALGGYVQWSWSRAHSDPAGGRVMLAVLPFENLTGDPTQDYFSDGLTEEMITWLGNLDPERLGVIARTSVMHYKRSPAPLDRIGRELRVQYVLEGSVRRDSNSVRIAAQLVQVRDQTHLWARQYDRDLSSLLAVQGEIAQAVANEIRLTLADGMKSSGSKRR